MNAIEKNFGREGISHPNKLEVCGSRVFSRKIHPQSSLHYCTCLKSPVLSVITINRVQDVCQNRIYNSNEFSSLEALDALFWEEREMDLNYYRNKKFNAVHIGDFILTSKVTFFYPILSFSFF